MVVTRLCYFTTHGFDDKRTHIRFIHSSFKLLASVRLLQCYVVVLCRSADLPITAMATGDAEDESRDVATAVIEGKIGFTGPDLVAIGQMIALSIVAAHLVASETAEVITRQEETWSGPRYLLGVSLAR